FAQAARSHPGVSWEVLAVSRVTTGEGERFVEECIGDAGKGPRTGNETPRAATDDPARPHVDRGNLEYGRGALDAAKRSYERAPGGRADGTEARVNLGIVLCAQGEIASGIAMLDECARMRPDSFEAHRNLGTALAAVGRYPEAAASLEHALALEPASVDAL